MELNKGKGIFKRESETQSWNNTAVTVKNIQHQWETGLVTYLRILS